MASLDVGARVGSAFSRRLKTVAVFGLFVPACSSGTVHTQSGVVLYSITETEDLGSCGGARQLLTMRTGHAVEIVSTSSAGTTVLPLVGLPASCTPSPIAATVLDLNADGTKDAVVMDSGCGSYVAVATEPCAFAVRPWDDVLPALDPVPYVTAAATSTGESALIAASPGGAAILESSAGGWLTSRTVEFAQPAVLQTTVSSMMLPVRGLGSIQAGALFQHEGATFSLVSFDSAVPDVDTYAQAPMDSAIAFYGFDQLTPLPLPPSCPPSALAVGIYPPLTPVDPRRLRRLSLASASYALSLVYDESPVDAVAAIADPASPDLVWAGLLGHDSLGPYFAVARVTCSDLQIGAIQPLGSGAATARIGLAATTAGGAAAAEFWWYDGEWLYHASWDYSAITLSKERLP